MENCFLEDAPETSLASRHQLRTVYVYFKYCNLKCRHCWINPPYSPVPAVREDESRLDEITKALDECRLLGMTAVKITGGEPFTRKDMPEFLDYLKKSGTRISIETNAVLIGQKEARAMKDAGVWHVGVSLDGPEAAIHESLRGVEGSFNGAIAGIRALKGEGLNIQIIASLWKGNSGHIKSIIGLARTLGASSIKINPIHGMCRADVMEEKDETLSARETIEVYDRLTRELAEESPFRVIFDIPPAFRQIDDVRHGRICTCGVFNILGILGDGRISICGIGSNVDTLVLGRIGKDSIREIWEGHPALKQIREGVPSALEGICGRCMLKHYCLGKCRAEAYYAKGSLLAPLSFCQKAYDEGLFPESRMIN